MKNYCINIISFKTNLSNFPSAAAAGLQVYSFLSSIPAQSMQKTKITSNSLLPTSKEHNSHDLKDYCYTKIVEKYNQAPQYLR